MFRSTQRTADCLLLKAGESVLGHEFHYSTLQVQAGLSQVDYPAAYEYQAAGSLHREGFAKANLLASYVHVHFASNPDVAKRFVATCREYQAKRSGSNR